MKRLTLAALILTTTGLAGGATWAAGTRTAAAAVWMEPAAAPVELGSAKATGDAAAPTATGAASAPTATGAALAPTATGAARNSPAVPAPATDPARADAAAKAAPGKHGTPPPFVQKFAAQPGVTRQRPRTKPTAPVKVAPTIDGCDRNYGTVAQCIPITFPKGVTDKCGWLTAHGFPALPVVGRDRQRLDPDRDGVACG